jgi:dienelactone hydrolase
MSRGGNVAMLAQSKKIKRCFIKGKLKFSSVVLYYPSCILQLKNVDLVNSPILILAGDKDNITPTSLTLKYAERLKVASKAKIEIKLYEGAFHAFDWEFFSGLQYKWFNDLSACQDRYILMEEDGMLYSPFQNKRYDAINKFGYLFADCQILSEGLLGGKKEARDKSIEDYKAFLKQTLLSEAGK